MFASLTKVKIASIATKATDDKLKKRHHRVAFPATLCININLLKHKYHYIINELYCIFKGFPYK